MRLHQLRVKNIASLKGEHLIDFSSIQEQSPLFAITGETGAGKSSILNSIGLALYGEIYKKNVNQVDVVTLGEKEGQIELLFQVHGKYYLADWRAKVRKQSGELLKQPQIQRYVYPIASADFEAIKETPIESIEKLLNLDFDQFCKCIILNQGEFARFLSSSFTERKEILEKLYPGEMLESLSRELKNELDQLLKQKSDLEIELKALQGDGPQAGDLKNEKQRLESNFKLHDSWLKNLESIEYHYISLHSYHTKYLENQAKIDSVKQTLSKETSVLNEFLLATQKASEALSVVQTEHEKSIPVLQELLKSEEGLKHLQDQNQEQQKAKLKHQENVSFLSDKLAKLKVHLEDWQQKFQATNKDFLLPYELLVQNAGNFDTIFELHSRLEVMNNELQIKNEHLLQVEAQGKEEARELKDLATKKDQFANEKDLLKELENKRKRLQIDIENNQRLELKVQESEKQLRDLNEELLKLKAHQEMLIANTKTLKDEHLPIDTTLKLQSLLNAVEICLTHPSVAESQECPVCHSDLKTDRLNELRSNISKTDLVQLKVKEAELSRSIIQKEEELKLAGSKQNQLKLEMESKSLELAPLKEQIKKDLPSLPQIDAEIAVVQKKAWEQEKLTQDEARLQQILMKTREQYLQLKKEIGEKTELQTTQQAKLASLLTPLGTTDIHLLKEEAKKLRIQLDLKSQGEKLDQEQKHLDSQYQENKLQLAATEAHLKDLSEKIARIEEKLKAELKNKKASQLILELNQKVKEKSEILTARERELKAQELKLKESQTRLYSLDELIKDIDLHFTKEIHAVKETSKIPLPALTEDLTLLINKLSGLSLDLNSPAELFIPLKDLIQSQKDKLKAVTSDLKDAFTSVKARLEDWEKKLDKITLLEMKYQDLTTILDRRYRLYEVLGKDELRTFVLSLVEENLIEQTNEELQKLCQGRYEIVHQSRRMKLTPEFYILDKFREGGLRKVSTLSGGETFMVSLAMALGLAEMTRGKAEIDSLFIDEGFGTLDQESLEDVLDMLKQIQTRGLMVGIISHIKTLTNALPVNLMLTKKTDGTSSIGIQYN